MITKISLYDFCILEKFKKDKYYALRTTGNCLVAGRPDDKIQVLDRTYTFREYLGVIMNLVFTDSMKYPDLEFYEADKVEFLDGLKMLIELER